MSDLDYGALLFCLILFQMSEALQQEVSGVDSEESFQAAITEDIPRLDQNKEYGLATYLKEVFNLENVQRQLYSIPERNPVSSLFDSNSESYAIRFTRKTTVFIGASVSTGKLIFVKENVQEENFSSDVVDARMRGEKYFLDRIDESSEEKREAQITKTEKSTLLTQNFLEGITLGKFLKNSYEKYRNNIEFKLRLATKIAEAISDAHNQGIIHSDLKPDNIFLVNGKAGVEVILIDLELARNIGEIRAETRDQIQKVGEESGQNWIPQYTEETKDTNDLRFIPDMMEGTPDYISPEQICSGVLSPKTDVYSFGVLLYKLFVGKHPLGEAKTFKEAIKNHMSENVDIEALKNAGISANLEILISSMLNKEANSRPDMDFVLGLLNAILNGTDEEFIYKKFSEAEDGTEISPVNYIDRVRGGVKYLMLGGVMLISAGSAQVKGYEVFSGDTPLNHQVSHTQAPKKQPKTPPSASLISFCSNFELAEGEKPGRDEVEKLVNVVHKHAKLVDHFASTDCISEREECGLIFKQDEKCLAVSAAPKHIREDDGVYCLDAKEISYELCNDSPEIY